MVRKRDETPSKQAAVIYIGPNLSQGTLNQYTVYKGGMPKHLEKHFADCPEIKNLFVPVDKFIDASGAVKKAGTSENVWFNKIKEHFKGGAK